MMPTGGYESSRISHSRKKREIDREPHQLSNRSQLNETPIVNLSLPVRTKYFCDRSSLTIEDRPESYQGEQHAIMPYVVVTSIGQTVTSRTKRTLDVVVNGYGTNKAWKKVRARLKAAEANENYRASSR
jgi:hypothetical protein